MYVEIEVKLKLNSPADTEQKLTELGAEFLTEQSQTDYFFDDANASLTTTDRCLRLRRQSVPGSERYFLTYKGPKEQSNFKKKQEIELEIKQEQAAQKLLSALGYEQILVIEKNRRLWQLGGCSVALDRLPLLGDFIEIEGPDDKTIAEVQKSLGLADLSHVTKSYARLTREKRAGRDT
jgi:adenylate cyclase class 2